jgi:hypothetical protein
MILLLGLYGCGTWSLTLRAEYRLWVFEDRTLELRHGSVSIHNFLLFTKYY